LGDDGQLGDGLVRPTDGTALTPVTVVDLDRVEAVDAGAAHTCALRRGEVWCWGGNQVGQLGDGTTRGRARAARVPGLTGVIGIAAGAGHQCAAIADGTVWCWGNGHFGQAGRVVGKPVLRPHRAAVR
jgi:alpha-tubulin suppressor-like RCC1 family protein